MTFIIRFLKNSYFIFKSSHKSFWQEVFLFITYLQIFFQEFFLVKLLKINLKSSNFFGYKIFFYSHSQFLSLFEDLFIHQEYYFKTDNKKPIILDCGSHIGTDILFFKKLYPRSQIVSFEPDKKTFSLLKKNISVNRLKNIILVNKAIFNKNGFFSFYNNPSDPGSTVMSLQKNRLHKDFIKVKTIKISSFIKAPIDFLKLDVEGVETKVIRELTSKGKLSFIKQGVIEYHHHIEKNSDQFSVLLSLLEKSGFGYQISTKLKPPFQSNLYQDLLIYFYKK